MSIKFKNVKPIERCIKMLSWDAVSFEDGQEEKYPVKKLVLTIEAGNMAELMVERYLTGDISNDILYASLSNGFTGPATFKNYYVVEKSDIPIEITVSGPKAKQETWKKKAKKRLKKTIKKIQKKEKDLLEKEGKNG